MWPNELLAQFWINRHNPLIFLLTLLCDIEAILAFYVYWTFDEKDEKRRRREQTPLDNLGDREQIHYERYRQILKLCVVSPNSGQTVTVRALLDTGAGLSCISTRLVDRLQLTRKLIWPKLLQCFPGTRSTFKYQSVQVQLKPINAEQRNAETVEPVEFIVDLREDFYYALSPSSILFELIQSQFGISLTDDDCTDKSLDLVIGQDLLNSHIFMREQKSLFLTDELAVIDTQFGHVVQGNFDSEKTWNVDQLPVKEQPNLIQSCQYLEDFSEKLTIEKSLWCSILVLPIRLVGLIELVILSIPIAFLLFVFSKIESLFKCFKPSRVLPIAIDNQKIPRKSLSKYLGYMLFGIFTGIKFLNENICNAFKKQYNSEEIKFEYTPLLVAKVSNPDTDGSQISLKTYLQFDSGANYSFISSSLAAKLQYKRTPTEQMYLRLDPLVKIEFNEAIRVRLQSVHNSEVVEEVQLLAHPDPNFDKIATTKPSPLITQLVESQFGIELPQLSDTEAHILIGTDILTSKFLLPQQKSIHLLQNLSLIPNRFGWTLNGASVLNSNISRDCFNFGSPKQKFFDLFMEFVLTFFGILVYRFLYFWFIEVLIRQKFR